MKNSLFKEHYMAVNGKDSGKPQKSLKGAINSFFSDFPNHKSCDVYQGEMAGSQFVANRMAPFEYEREL